MRLYRVSDDHGYKGYKTDEDRQGGHYEVYRQDCGLWLISYIEPNFVDAGWVILGSITQVGETFTLAEARAKIKTMYE